jgi:hypothetical protein
VGLNF